MAAIEQMAATHNKDAGILVYHASGISAGDHIYGVNASKEFTGTPIHGIYGKHHYSMWFHTKGVWKRTCHFREEDKADFEALDADGFVFENPGWLPMHGSTDGRTWLTYVSMSPGSTNFVDTTSHPGTDNYSEVNKLSDAWTCDFDNNVITNKIDADMGTNVVERKAYVGATNKISNVLSTNKMFKTDVRYESEADNSDIACVTIALADPENDIDNWNSEAYLQWNGDSAAQTITRQSSDHYVISLFKDTVIDSTTHTRGKINKLTSASVDIDHPGSDNIIISVWKS